MGMGRQSPGELLVLREYQRLQQQLADSQRQLQALASQKRQRQQQAQAQAQRPKQQPAKTPSYRQALQEWQRENAEWLAQWGLGREDGSGGGGGGAKQYDVF